MNLAFEAGRRLSKTMKNQFVGFLNYRTGNSHKLETMKLDRRESRSKHTQTYRFLIRINKFSRSNSFYLSTRRIIYLQKIAGLDLKGKYEFVKRKKQMKNIRPVACAALGENEGRTRVDISGGAIRNSQHVFQCSDSAGHASPRVAHTSHAI